MRAPTEEERYIQRADPKAVDAILEGIKAQNSEAWRRYLASRPKKKGK